MTQSADTPIERFKRATAATLRAVSRDAELTVGFSGAQPGQPPAQSEDKGEVRLPLPSRDLPLEEVLLARGECDAAALRRRYHNDKVHNRTRPHELVAREISDRVCYLHEGVILEQAPPEQLFGDPQRERTKAFLQRVTDAGRM